jgi:hypothetical protein
MKVSPELLKVLHKACGTDHFIHQRFSQYDLVFKTDERGRPVLLFMGQADAEGNI